MQRVLLMQQSSGVSETMHVVQRLAAPNSGFQTVDVLHFQEDSFVEC